MTEEERQAKLQRRIAALERAIEALHQAAEGELPEMQFELHVLSGGMTARLQVLRGRLQRDFGEVQ